MPRLTELTLYPIKSCAGIALESAQVTAKGLYFSGVYDREWMLVDTQGMFITQREYPKMAAIRPSIVGDELHLHFAASANFPTLTLAIKPTTNANNVTRQVQVWDDVLHANDAGDEAANWFSSALGVPCRLVRFDPTASRIASSRWVAGQEIPTHFSDGFPMLLIGQASLDDLNEKLLKKGLDAVPMNRFRPNLVIEGCEAFEEDYAESLSFGNDSASIILKPVKPCPRCPMPAVDQVLGEVGPNPVDMLQTYRVNPLVDDAVTFGMNVILRQGEGGILQRGAELELQIAF